MYSMHFQRERKRDREKKKRERERDRERVVVLHNYGEVVQTVYVQMSVPW